MISLWSTAPYLLNNRLGPFDPNPAVDNRVQDRSTKSIRQLLWPETREMDPVHGNRVEGVIDRTKQRSWVFIPGAIYDPGARTRASRPQHLVRRQLGRAGSTATAISSSGRSRRGMPIGALTNLNLRGPENDDKNEQRRGDFTQFVKLLHFFKRLGHVLIGNERRRRPTTRPR